MNTIASTLKKSKTQLQTAGIPSFSLDANLLVGSALNLSREDIIRYPERELTTEEYESFEELLKRRIAREPMAHILGTREFWGRDFKVTAATLDPRPDSETLIEAVLDIYKNTEKPENILDFGTGTGCLLLTILCEFPKAKGLAVDASQAALSIAKENSAKLGLAKRCEFVVSNWGREVKGRYDLIISNPPYIKNSDIDGLEPEVSGYEPKLALDGGDSGLECYEELAPYISSLLSINGFAVLEHGIGQEQDVRTIMEKAGLKFVAYKKDLAGINRCVVIRKSS